MSTFQPRIHSPPARQAYSPKLTPSACLSPPNSGHHSKKPTKQATKSPISNKDKRSPTRNSTLRSQYDTKLTDACSPTGNKAHGPHHQHQGSTVTGRKNQQNLKEDKQKVKNYSENVMPFDKPRRSDHHLLYPHHDSKVPYKQKSHSVKSVCVPQELLLSPKSYDPNLAGALLSKKVQTAKHSSRNEPDLHNAYNMDLVALYNKQMEENRYCEERNNQGNKFFSTSTNSKPKRKVNTPEHSPVKESKRKFESKVSPRAYELLVGSPARNQSNQQQQKTLKPRFDNFMQGRLPDIEEQCEDNIKASSDQSKTTKGSEVRTRTGSVPNEIMYEDMYGYSQSKSPVRPKTTKHSEPNIYSDIKRTSEETLKTKYVSSTRSALGRFENQFNTADGQHVEEDDYDKENNEREKYQEQQDREENQYMADLLKGNTLRELKLNPNAKFLLLRDQVRERRNRTGFKSADWNGNEDITKLASQHQTNPTSPTKERNLSPQISPILCQSPNVLRSADVSTSPIKSASKVSEDIKGGIGGAAANEQLVQIFNKTKNMLASYKNKEMDWEKERKLFVAEIKRLRGLLKEAWN